MERYEGPQEDDPGPVGGGAFNEENLGGESHNFLVRDRGRILGFVHSGRKRTGQIDGLNLNRIDPDCPPNANSVGHVFVIFLATVPPEHKEKLGNGTCVVGWYKHATAYDTAAHPNEPLEYYNLETVEGEWTRIHVERREAFDLSGPLGMGQMNVRYPYSETGELLGLGPMEQVLQYVRNYKIQTTSNESDQRAAVEVEVEEAKYRSTPGLRKAIEDYSMDQAESCYKRLGYEVARKGKPYDLLCVRGSETLYVEVKGSTSSGVGIILTRNEVDQPFLAKGGEAELFVVHGITQAQGDPLKLSGGSINIYSRWRPLQQ